MVEVVESEAKMVPFNEQCDQALKHYEEISNEASHYSSFVPKAIEFYKRFGVPRGERKIVTTKPQLQELLDDGWVFDPWVNPNGRPMILSENEFYWVLVKGTPEQLENMKPFAVLPEEDEPEGPEDGTDPYGLRVEFIPYGPKGEPIREPKPGYVVMDRGHIYAKGAAYTLPPKPLSVWSLAVQLAGISGVMGVDEAHAIITGILKPLHPSK